MKLFKIIISVLFFVIIITGSFGYFLLKNDRIGQMLTSINNHWSDPNAGFNWRRALGFDAPRTYLLLFLNNTELRPGGGFIGAYAVVRVQNGRPDILKIEGSEILDKNAVSFVDFPPEPIARRLKTKHWYFRDSNWSPDFAQSSQRALEIYQAEGGIAAADVDAVVGFTPTVVEELLKVIGPITVEGIEFNASNFTEKLEYEVEYGYEQRGERVSERKNLIADVADALGAKFKQDSLVNWPKYFALAQRMFAEKQVAVYESDASVQNFLQQKNWTGKMLAADGDYLMWVDANLGALKTDAAISRSLNYEIMPTGAHFLARASMKYTHQGKHDWRTGNYRAYSRVFVPIGSELVKVMGASISDKEGALSWDQGVDNGKQWFGAYLNISPGTTATLTFEYLLPETVIRQIATKQYNLLVQKQIGTNDVSLTLDLDFGKKVINDDGKVLDKYFITKNLATDKEFKIVIFKL